MLRPNINNPLGLFQKDGITHQLVAYFQYNNCAEFGAASKKHLSINRSEYYYHVAPREYLSLPAHELMTYHIKHFFPKDYTRYIGEHGGFGFCFLFKRYDDPIPMRNQKHIARKSQQAVLDYFTGQDKLPLLITDNCFFDFLDNVSLDRERKCDRERNRALTWNDVKRILCDSRQHNPPFEGQPKGDVKPVPEYPEFEQYDMQVMALLKGGFTSFIFKDVEYLMPILPTMALAQNIQNDEFTHGMYTWLFNSESVSITDKILDDIFIIGNVRKNLRENKHFIDSLILHGKTLL